MAAPLCPTSQRIHSPPPVEGGDDREIPKTCQSESEEVLATERASRVESAKYAVTSVNRQFLPGSYCCERRFAITSPVAERASSGPLFRILCCALNCADRTSATTANSFAVACPGTRRRFVLLSFHDQPPCRAHRLHDTREHTVSILLPTAPTCRTRGLRTFRSAV